MGVSGAVSTVDQSCNCWNILNSVRLARPCNYWNILYVDALSNYWINMWNISINPYYGPPGVKPTFDYVSEDESEEES